MFLSDRNWKVNSVFKQPIIVLLWSALVFGVLVLVSCTAKPAVQAISLERTACFGSCPVYSLHIDSSGAVSYTGINHVAALGIKTATIDSSQFQELLKEFVRIGFTNLHDKYRVGPHGGYRTDMPTTFIRLTQNGTTKSIEDYDYAPLELRELERRVERTVNVHQWIHDKTKRLTLGSPDAGPETQHIEDLKNEPVVWFDSNARIKPRMSSLMEGAGKGDPTEMRAILRSGSNINEADESGWTSLMIASVSAHPEAVKLLLRSGASVNQKDSHGNTALIGASAVRFNLDKEPDTLRTLILKGALVDEVNDLGETALMWAAKAGNPEGLSILLKSGANPQRADSSGHNAQYYLTKARTSFSYNNGVVTRYDRAAVVLEQALEQRGPVMPN